MVHDKAVSPYEFNLAILLDKHKKWAETYRLMYRIVRQLYEGEDVYEKAYRDEGLLTPFCVAVQKIACSTLPVIWFNVADEEAPFKKSKIYRRMTYLEVQKYGKAIGYYKYLRRDTVYRSVGGP